ncbi:alanine racemase [Thalassotalea ponticola]|uniref:alanine racemase n=1 Tax=Thalassotalea ponticola TaxID=1523392 RepID=UPI0025B30E7D|nr:alanine racemase [Thalassotalea ponticola]MDN3652784.1 alanine racemase [Thalassotalea ponticola]
MTESYQQYEKCLKIAGINSPSLFIDLDRLDHNIQQLQAQVANKALRLVVPSLPSLQLLSYISERLNCSRFMCFHTPFILELLEHFDEADILMGKPLPTNSVEHIIKYLIKQQQQAKIGQIHWLVDDQSRARQLLTLGRKYNICFKVAIEIDIGMKRGGVSDVEQLKNLQQFICQNKKHLKLNGLMGYDGHVTKAPTPFVSRERVFQQSQHRYQQFVDALTPTADDFIFNGGGSATHTYHQYSCINEVSVGSILLKPTCLESANLAMYRGACFIATQVLKRIPGIQMPLMPNKIQQWTKNFKHSVYLYGGRWPVKCAYPKLISNCLYGLSSNQQQMLIDSDRPLEVDDFVFFRPKKIDAQLLALGDILVIRRHNQQVRVEQSWSIMSQRKAKPVAARLNR